MPPTIYRAEYHSGTFPAARDFRVQIINPGESSEVVRVLGYSGGKQVFDSDNHDPASSNPPDGNVPPGNLWTYRYLGEDPSGWEYHTYWVIIQSTSQYLVPSVISSEWVVAWGSATWPVNLPRLCCSPGDFTIIPIAPRVVVPGVIGPDEALTLKLEERPPQ